MAEKTARRRAAGVPNRLYWTTPYVAVVVFALTMLLLVWVLQRQEAEVQHNAIARDVQWAEQTMRLHMQATEEFLTQMARDLAAGALDLDGFQVRANQHIANNPQLINIVWVAADEVVHWSAPFDTTDWLAGDALTAAQSTPYFKARDIGRVTYGEAYVNSRNEAVLEVFVPVRNGRHFMGAMVGVYSIDRIVRHLVPDWFSEKYRLALISAHGKPLAVNSLVAAIDESISYSIPLDPPGNGLVLQATAFRTVGDIPRALPVVLIVGLSFFVLWSLWLLRGHMVRRVRVEKERDRLFNLSLDILSILNADGSFRRCNPAFERLLGYPVAGMPGRTLIEFVHDDDVAATVEQLRRLASGQPVSFENRIRCEDGGYKWLAWSINPVPEEQLLYAVAHDVTGRKDSEEALRAESAFRRAMEESVITGLRAIDMNGRITYVNPAFCRLVGRDAEELVGAEAPFPYWPPDQRETCQVNLELTLSGKAPPSGFEMQIVRRNGDRIDTRFYLSPLIDGTGRQTGWMASVTDITEPKRVRAALESAQARFEAVLDGLDAAVFVADPHSDEILYANRAFKALHGYDAVGRQARKVAEPQPEMGDYRIDPRRLGPADVPLELFDGELRHALSGRWYHVREHATRWVDGRVVRMGIATDITDRRQMEAMARQQEERLQRTARLVTMGEMASTLAHELNQPLAAISNYAMGCVRRLETGEYKESDLLAAMQKASFQAERAGKIIRRIRDFVRKSEPRRSAVVLADIVDDALGFAEIDARKSLVRIHRDVSRDLPPVFADRIMIEQVVLNLVKNAIDAMAAMPEEERQLELVARQVDGMIEVSVADRGHGILAEDAERLFTPFYTTKSEGMGMGLNICRSIIEFHDGRLWLEPNPEGGTVFRFTLPVEIASERDVRRA
ncbi:PAS domain S-box protein [Nitrogeniibacter mangrovi]|uniref:histidine kinase n=1 Tax=Nitrogeniibacter mangrovi TaxID=2016596 RepID=A0A6C1B4G7_9RHOO|nr:PAS domain S-box protein [Nitrogeniibacter mangrovi]QID18596.1 PAS domain S-box protein [Nitrogeniibacter mangrovi]